MNHQSLSLYAIPGVPLIYPGDDLTKVLITTLLKSNYIVEDNDILAIAQKIVSKAEGRIVNLKNIIPSQKTIELAKEVDKDPRLVEVILSESKSIINYKPGVIIVEHLSGIILANAGIDHSNIDGDDTVTLLPNDANRSARDLKKSIEQECGKKIGIIITDSVGRPWRLGTIGVALGTAGIQVIQNLCGNKDLFGRELIVSETADADSLASAACLLMGEGNNATPLILIRGMNVIDTEDDTGKLLRPRDTDMFRII